ncbi:MAG: uracil-DNA glycosylase [Geminicoccaceae bacterium]|nr:uracil-DNA glycosylase [Geminicoccaceae bacterium]MCS7266878.1 uracil-DNA glycosylase [Geminicoccaceae bacterium]MDW8124198.1 uracil-DNA glycosylase [Geminicoccaceae bacterium]MDW8340579.1 uracil-DNA glycosylase [Geminicoccaceae bacterium]
MTVRAAPPPDCALCPRLVAYRATLRAARPDWHNAPVASFGPEDAGLLIVGLAPGRAGANRTGLPFTGDRAGDVLRAALLRHGLARRQDAARPSDGLELLDCRIANALRCVPPANRPLRSELVACRPFLAADLQVEPRPGVILALGRIAHEAIFRALRLPLRPFAHGRRDELPDGRLVFASYHTSRYNSSTGRLASAMFDDLIGEVARALRVWRSSRAVRSFR